MWHVIERSTIYSPGPNLIVPDIGTKIADAISVSTITTFEENECNRIVQALKQTGGKAAEKEGAAELLGINIYSSRLHRKKPELQKTSRSFFLSELDLAEKEGYNSGSKSRHTK